jgi:hypothetical protein
MKFTKGLLSLQALWLLVVLAYAQDVHYNYDRGANFSSYKTYQWVDLPNGVPDQLVDRDIKRAIDEQLTMKGLTKIEKDADVLVGYQAIVNLEKGITLSGFGMRDRVPGAWGGWDSGTVTGQTSTIPVGTLLVSVYDPAKKQLIWRGDASKSVDLKKDPEKNYKNLQKAMAKLFKNYPPTGK